MKNENNFREFLGLISGKFNFGTTVSGVIVAVVKLAVGFKLGREDLLKEVVTELLGLWPEIKDKKDLEKAVYHQDQALRFFASAKRVKS